MTDCHQCRTFNGVPRFSFLPRSYLLRFERPLPPCQAKYLSAEFKSLPDNEKAKWDSLAQRDKERYQRDMESYVPPSDESDSDSDAGKKKKKKKKDPNAPKRNQSAFFLYSNATRAEVRATNPDLAFGQVAQEISRNFKALPAEERQYWDQKAAADKVRYQREMANYKGD